MITAEWIQLGRRIYRTEAMIHCSMTREQFKKWLDDNRISPRKRAKAKRVFREYQNCPADKLPKFPPKPQKKEITHGKQT